MCVLLVQKMLWLNKLHKYLYMLKNYVKFSKSFIVVCAEDMHEESVILRYYCLLKNQIVDCSV